MNCRLSLARTAVLCRKHWPVTGRTDTTPRTVEFLVVLAELDSSVGVATTHGLDGPGLEYRERGKSFSLQNRPARLWDPTQPYIQRLPGFLGVKRAGREVNHQHPPVTYVKNEWSHSSVPHIPSWDGQGQLYLFTFTFSLVSRVTSAQNWLIYSQTANSSFIRV